MKITDYMQGRNEGMAFALKIAKEKGIEGLENECKFRNATNIPSQVNRKYADKMVEQIKGRTLETVLLMSLCVLRDEYDFGTVRLEKFTRRFMGKTEGLLEDYATWNDLREVLSDECGIKIYEEDDRLIIEVKGERISE